MVIRNRTSEWLLAAVLALFIGVGIGVSAIIGSASEYIEEEEEIGNLVFKQLGDNLYSMTGDVGVGDCERIVPQLPTTEPFTVILESPGGSLQDGICLASHLKLRNVITVVRDTPVLDQNGEYLYKPGMATDMPNGEAQPHDDGRSPLVVCASSCSVMFLGGDERYLIGDVYLGIHSPRAVDPTGGPELAEAQAYATAAGILGFLETQLGVESSDLRRLFITIPANSMYWVHPDHFDQAPYLLGLATHYLRFHGLNAVNPWASVLAAAQEQAQAIAQGQIQFPNGGN